MENKIRNYRKDIQVFRAFAVISVVIYHLFPINFENLKIGVDIFFVISGFVITKSILNSNQFGINEFQEFLRKRITRIFPLSIISSLIIWVIFTILSPGFFSERDTFSSIFGIQNLLLGRVGRPYGGLNLNLNPYTHFWSLGIEAQFYLIYPIFLLIFYWILTKNKKKQELKNNSKKIYQINYFYKNLRNLLLFFGIISFIGYSINYNPADAWSYFNPFLRFWEIIIGCLAFLYSLKINSYKENDISKKEINKIYFLIIFITFFIIYSIFGSSKFHSILLFSTLTFFGNYISNPIEKNLLPISKNFFLPFKILEYVGEISFSIYIWHWPLILFFKIIFGGLMNLNLIVFYFVILFVISVLSKKLIENFCSFHLSRSNLNKESIIFIFSLFSLSITTIGINEAKNNLANKFRPYKSKTTPSTFFTKVPIIEEGLCSWGFENSFTDNEDYENLFDCLDKQKSTQKFSRNIFLFGDSHSTSIAPGVYKYTQEKKYNFMKAAHVYCPFRLQYSMNWKVDNSLKNFSCSNFNKAVFDYLIQNSSDGDLVILSSRDLFYFSETLPLPRKNKKNYEDGFIEYFDNLNNKISIKKVKNQSVKDLEKLASKLDKKKVNIIVILQGHENANPLHYCDHIFSSNIKTCSTDYEKIKNKKSYSRLVNNLAIKNQKISSLDLLKYTCPVRKDCGHMIKDKYIFRDEDHITSYFAKEYFYDDFKKFVNKITKSIDQNKNN